MNRSVERPIVAITLGDPAGIGPEVVAKALATPRVGEICRPLVFGWPEILERELRRLGLSLKVRSVTSVKEALFQPEVLEVLKTGELSAEEVPLGKIHPPGALSAVEAVRQATESALRGEVSALVTGPVNKKAVDKAGVPFTGHTEFIAEITRAKTVRMLLMSPSLWVVHVTTHLSLREAIERIRQPQILETIRLGYQACLRLGISSPRLAVAGLNPHAGEQGLFGREEEEEIRPAILSAQQEGIPVEGPLPADTLFLQAARGRYNLVVAMYHDQGHIPVKLTGFEEAVNVTLGLPIIRTSVDHGTGFDIAGKGIADPRSMLRAIEVAVQMVGS